jgi:uroporphyrinogen-III decarboxylase
VAENLLITVAKALVKGKLHIGRLTGLERFILTQITVPDRVPTFLVAGNVYPTLIDPKYNYKILTESAEANIELFSRLKERLPFDVITAPTWGGLLFTGPAELGVKFSIDENNAPYPSEHIIKGMQDVHNIVPLKEPSGHFKMALDIYRDTQRRHPDTLITYVNDGPWDLAMLLRGDQHLPRDFRLYKDFVETTDPARREKIKNYGNPDLWPAIMELTTRVAIQNFRLARQYGIDMTGAMMMDQFAAEPVINMDDFVKYILPYILRAWEALDKKVSIGYMCSSPQKLEKSLTHPVLGKALKMSGHTSYIFPTTPEGLTLPEYDQPMVDLARRNNKAYSYVLHAKFIRDATNQELEDAVKRICQMAVSARTRLMIFLPTIAPGTDLKKVDLIQSSVEKYGRY